MSGEDEPTAVVRKLAEPLLTPGGLDFKRAIDDAQFRALLERHIAPDAPVLYEVPGGGFVGGMAGPFQGPHGYVEGWREWVEAWDEFRIEVRELIAAGERDVVVLVTVTGRLRDSDAVVQQTGGAVYSVASGRVVKLQHFLDEGQARAAAGLT
jgi:SnoaL-like protein